VPTTRGVSPYEVPWPGRPKGPGPRIWCTRFVFLGRFIICRLKFNPFRPSPSHSAAESQSLRYSVSGGEGPFFFNQGPKPLSKAKDRTRVQVSAADLKVMPWNSSLC